MGRHPTSHLSPRKRALLKKNLEDSLTLARSSIKGAGKGVFATKDLPKGFQIPYFGKLYRGKWKEIEPFVTDFTYVFHDEEEAYVIDAHPRFNRCASNFGFRINEPSRGKKPNSAFKTSTKWASLIAPISIVLTKSVKAGEEIWVYYGSEYDRSDYVRK